MSNKLIALVVGIFVLIVAGMFGFAYLKKAEAPIVLPQTEAPEIDVYKISRIEGTHFFDKGVHTIIGELPLPTACDLLTGTSTVTGATNENVLLSFSVVNTSTTCTQQTVQARYSISAVASSSATFTAEFMGKVVELNLTEATPGTTPDQFELYIKG